MQQSLIRGMGISMPANHTPAITQHNIFILVLTLLVLVGAPVYLFLDSQWILPYFSHGQNIANGIMVIIYVLFLLLASRKLYWLILLMTISSFFAEIIGSIIFSLYRYHLNNIPMYIPMGHAVIYTTMYHICRMPWVWRYHQPIERCLGKFAFVAAFLSLFIIKDIGGFICYIIFLGILKYRKKPLFYLLMFVMVYYIELLGTVFSTWSWYSVLGNHPNFPSIGYTPSGMAGLYILIDLVSNSIYFYAHKILRYLRRSGVRAKITDIKPDITYPSQI